MEVYQNDPKWTPPLEKDVKDLLDPKVNPFFLHAEVALFLAERDGKILGRVAAIANRSHTEYHQDGVGFFGLFESSNEPEVAGALLEVAADWLHFRGYQAMRGPMNLSMNEDFGISLEDDTSQIPLSRALQPYNPSYYRNLFFRSGLDPVKDCLAFAWSKEQVPYGVQEDLAAKTEIPGLRIRSVRSHRLRTLLADLKSINGVYHAAWKHNWGFLPTSDQELEYTARRLKSILDPNLMKLAEVNGEIVGMILGVPDYHGMLRTLQGKTYPWALPRALKTLRAERTAVLIAFGVRPSFQGTGLADALIGSLLQSSRSYEQYETNWVLDDNSRVQHFLRHRFQARVVKRFRIFERRLD